MPDTSSPYFNQALYDSIKKQVESNSGLLYQDYTQNQVYNSNDKTDSQLIKDFQIATGQRLVLQNDYIAGYATNPPAGLSYSELVKWYRNTIISVVGTLSDYAIELGEQPNKVGQAVVLAGQTLTQISTGLSAVASVGSTLATIASFATPITLGITGILGALSILGVFDGDDKKRKQMSSDYQKLSSVLQFWYQDYAVAYAKMSAVEQLEFKKELEKLYGSGGTDSTNVPKTGTGSGIIEVVTGYYQYIILAVILLALYWYSKRSLNG